MWCGPWASDVRTPSIHVRVGTRGAAVDAERRRRRRPPPANRRFPHTFIFDKPTGAQFFAAEGRNEASTSEEESSGRDHVQPRPLRHAPGRALPRRRRHGQRVLRRHVDRDPRVVQRRAARGAASRVGSRAVTGPLLAVDAPSLLYRAFFALPKTITDDDGHPVNALLGMANLMLFEVERHSPRAVVLCFGAEAADYRTDAFEAYHADRPPMPDELERQWADAPALLRRVRLDDAAHARARSRRPARLAREDRGAGRRRRAALHRRPRHVPVRRRARHGAVSARRQGRPGGHRARRGPRALRDRAGAGARLHRAARRPVRRPAGREGHRREGRARPPAQARHARRRHRGRGQARRR